MALIVIATNQSKLAPVSDYTVEVLVGDGTVEGSHVIAVGAVNGHTRADGWRKLIQRVLDEVPDFDWEGAVNGKADRPRT